MKHHPQIYKTGRHGCWCCCLCGWRSRLWTTGTGAHLEFGEHLLAEVRRAATAL